MKHFLSFLIGAGVGCIGSYLYLKKKFEKDLNKGLEQARKYKGTSLEPPKEEIKEEIKPVPSDNSIVFFEKNEKPNVIDYAKIAMAKEPKTKPVQKHEDRVDLYLVSKERYEEMSDDYDIEDLIVYSDGVVTDIRDKIFTKDFTELVDNVSFEDFDDEGYLYIADDLRKKVYEVSMDQRSYKEVFGVDE